MPQSINKQERKKKETKKERKKETNKQVPTVNFSSVKKLTNNS